MATKYEMEMMSALLVSLCCGAQVGELRKKLDSTEFKQLLTAPLKYRDFQHETILHYMCAYSYEEEGVVQVLLENGASTVINTGVIPPLCYAAQSNHKKIVKLLLKHGANPELALRYTTNPEILSMLHKRDQEIKRAKAEKKAKEKLSITSSRKSLSSGELQKTGNAIQVIEQKLLLMFSFSDITQSQKIASKLAMATSFDHIASALEMLCRACAPKNEKALSEFMVTLFMLPWNLTSFARHVAIAHHGQANRVMEALFHTIPAYKIAVYVESKLAAYERDRPRSSFPHLYVSLIEAFTDAISSSFVDSAHCDDLSSKTSKLLKWLSMVGFISNGTEYTVSLLRFRLMHKTLNLSFRHIMQSQDSPPSTSPTSTSPTSSSPTSTPPTSPPLTSTASSSSTMSDSTSVESDSSPNLVATDSPNLNNADSPRSSHHTSSYPLSTLSPCHIIPSSTSPKKFSNHPPSNSVITPYSLINDPPSNVLVGSAELSAIVRTRTHSPAFLVNIKVKHGMEVSLFKLYSTASLAYLHDKISHRMRGPTMGPERIPARPIIVTSKCGRTIVADEEGSIYDLDLSTGVLELEAMLE